VGVKALQTQQDNEEEIRRHAQKAAIARIGVTHIQRRRSAKKQRDIALMAADWTT
jgi:hypothetical protein